MKYFIISTLCTSLLLFYSCDDKTSSPPSENKSKNSSVISIKPKLARHFATVDSTITFNNLNILLRISQRVVPEEATKVILKNDTIYCNQSYVDIMVYIDKKYSISKRFDKSTYEWLIDEPLDSVVWGHKGIDSVTRSGIYV
ncbi:MAG: hypothetical protein KBF59_06910 [Ignavibacterium sp.]|nr:hypothetical protein [Ignavibacterium sp.]